MLAYMWGPLVEAVPKEPDMETLVLLLQSAGAQGAERGWAAADKRQGMEIFFGWFVTLQRGLLLLHVLIWEQVVRENLLL